MNRLYVGNKRIKSATIKTKVNTDFITAGANDIMSGKKSIDKDYNTLTGTMTITDSLQSLTTDATATAAEVTSGKTGYKNGAKVTGTAVRRTNPSSVIDGIIEAYKVANNNVITAGDFVKFVEEVCGCGYETTTINSTESNILWANSINMAILQYSVNKILFLFSDSDNYLAGTIFTINNSTITFTTPQRWFDINPSVMFLFSMANSQIVGIMGGYAVRISISSNNTITITGYGVFDNYASSGFIRNAVLLDTNEIFVTGEKSDGYDDYISYSRVKMVNNNLVVTRDIPTDRLLYVANNSHTVCRLTRNKLLVAYSQIYNTRNSKVLSIDISDPNYVYAGVDYDLSVQATYAYHSIPVEDGVGMISYYTGSSSGGIGYVAACKVNGNGLYINTKSVGPTGSDIERTRLCQLTTTLSVLAYVRTNGIINVVPIKRTAGSNDITYGSIFELINNGRSAINLAKIEDNKVVVTYVQYTSDYRVKSKILQINNQSTVSTVLTVYDMTSPLTETMVALATGNDTINGIADSSGIGKLYGGTTINIIKPRTN